MHPRGIRSTNHRCTVEGLSPSNTMYENRIKEIQEAIQRYIDARYTIPKEWYDELNQLISILDKME